MLARKHLALNLLLSNALFVNFLKVDSSVIAFCVQISLLFNHTNFGFGFHFYFCLWYMFLS